MSLSITFSLQVHRHLSFGQQWPIRSAGYRFQEFWSVGKSRFGSYSSLFSSKTLPRRDPFMQQTSHHSSYQFPHMISKYNIRYRNKQAWIRQLTIVDIFARCEPNSAGVAGSSLAFSLVIVLQCFFEFRLQLSILQVDHKWMSNTRNTSRLVSSLKKVKARYYLSFSLDLACHRANLRHRHHLWASISLNQTCFETWQRELDS